MSKFNFDCNRGAEVEIGIIKEVDSLGRVVIPKELRERYELKGRVEMVATKEGILLKNQEYYLVKRNGEN